MTVYKIGQKKLEITLSDSEVISFFGTYGRLTSVNKETRMTVGLILRESLLEYGTELDGNLLVVIKAKENFGCIITVSPADYSRRIKKSTQIIFEFSDTDALINGTVRLYKCYAQINSSIYKMPKAYRLVITSRSDCDFFFMNEFCTRQSDSKLEAAYTAEYGKLICEKNAVEKIGKAFI